MIEQHNYTTTPTYNLPPSPDDLQLPQPFIELSQYTMQNIQSTTMHPNTAETTQQTTAYIENTAPITTIQHPATITTTQLQPDQNLKPVVAVDVSSIRIGETQAGALCAIRGAIVWKEKNRYRYQRLGPFPFHITEENKTEIHKLFQNNHFEIGENHRTPNINNIQARIGNLLERWLQLGISCSAHDTIILWDGSMTAGMPDSPTDEMSRLLETARNRLSTVLAFSKNTTLRFDGQKLTDLANKAKPPCLIKVNNYPVCSGPVLLLGNVYVAKLSSGVCQFRLDIDKKVSHEQAVEAVQSLLGNDLIVQSYPETLRLAHIYSTFTATEVIGIQRFISKQYGLRMVTRPNVRRMLFGMFGKGAEATQ
ncbi:MAG: hypothetical protein NWF03_05290 [Candidatus Bathyarchaeota archaeon]|nr:hypothetical protein [Candidatus Bathyarchaeota archaeon]